MTPVERVARALCRDPDGSGPTMTGETGPWPKNWERKVPDARAAIEALEWPTPEMVAAGRGQMPVQIHHWVNHEGHHAKIIGPNDKDYVSPAGVFRAMILAALAPSGPER